MKRILLAGFIFGLMCLISSQGVAAEAKTETLRIGALLHLSGGAALWGIPTLRACELMTEKINREGGIKTGNAKFNVELVKADDKSNYNDSVAQANRLIFNENVRYIVGPIISGCVLAILPVTQANKVMVFGFSDSPKILGPDKQYSFRPLPTFRERIPAVYSYMRQNRPEIKKVALIGPNDESGWGNSDIAKNEAKQYGLEVVFEDFAQRGTADFFPVLTRMMAKKPDLLIPHAFPEGEVALILQQSHQLGYKGLSVGTTPYNPEGLLAKAGAEAVEGFMFLAPDLTGPASTPGMREFHRNYVEKYKIFDPVAVAGYPYLWIIKLAIEKAGTCETQAVAKAMESLDGEMPYGRFAFGGLKTYGARHQIIYPIFLSQFKGGKWVYLGGPVPDVP